MKTSLITVEIKLLIIFIFFLLILTLEKKYPFYKKRLNILKHDASNLAVAAFNLIVFNSLFAYLTIKITSIKAIEKYALFEILSINIIIQGLVTILILDLWTYTWHRLNHQVKFLRRFHKAHHTDTMMNVTTSLRFHFIEFFLSFLSKSIIIALLGINFYHLIVYEIILNLCVYFHHSNINLNKDIDSMLNKLIVTPNMHRFHHSVISKERNSNYSGLLTIWDKLFNSYTYEKEVEKIKFGIPGYLDKKWDSFYNILITPFK